MFGEYDLQQQVSMSGTGNVYRAKNVAMDRTVLLKMMPDQAKTDEGAQKRFQREVRLAAQLSHPNLVAALHAGCQDGIHYLVLENVEGIDLTRKVERDGPLDVATAVDYICQAATGLAYLHKQGVIHRNVTPANLMLDTIEHVHVTNMILARIDEQSKLDSGGTDGLTQQGQMIGTADYRSPEQAIDAHAADGRSDIYSLGCAFYYLLTGKPPYPEEEKAKKIAAHAGGPIPSLREVREDVSEKLDEVFQRMLAKLPDDRYQSMTEAITALQRALYSGGESRSQKRSRFAWELLIGGILIGILAGGLASLVLSVE